MNLWEVFWWSVVWQQVRCAACGWVATFELRVGGLQHLRCCGEVVFALQTVRCVCVVCNICVADILLSALRDAPAYYFRRCTKEKTPGRGPRERRARPTFGEYHGSVMSRLGWHCRRGYLNMRPLGARASQQMTLRNTSNRCSCSQSTFVLCTL